mmetsp:Transcript_10294/g.28045  ORF Transcript_10294/g.28045 Transcript_10294/m.28045 type:complete len:271 (+) Transcript_10294:1172-1984(+)
MATRRQAHQAVLCMWPPTCPPHWPSAPQSTPLPSRVVCPTTQPPKRRRLQWLCLAPSCTTSTASPASQSRRSSCLPRRWRRLCFATAARATRSPRAPSRTRCPAAPSHALPAWTATMRVRCSTRLLQRLPRRRLRQIWVPVGSWETEGPARALAQGCIPRAAAPATAGPCPPHHLCTLPPTLLNSCSPCTWPWLPLTPCPRRQVSCPPAPWAWAATTRQLAACPWLPQLLPLLRAARATPLSQAPPCPLCPPLPSRSVHPCRRHLPPRQG